MQNAFWLNMGSKDLAKAKILFQKLGFNLNEKASNPDMLSMLMGNKKTVLNLFT